MGTVVDTTIVLAALGRAVAPAPYLGAAVLPGQMLAAAGADPNPIVELVGGTRRWAVAFDAALADVATADAASVAFDAAGCAVALAIEPDGDVVCVELETDRDALDPTDASPASRRAGAVTGSGRCPPMPEHDGGLSRGRRRRRPGGRHGRCSRPGRRTRQDARAVRRADRPVPGGAAPLGRRARRRRRRSEPREPRGLGDRSPRSRRRGDRGPRREGLLLREGQAGVRTCDPGARRHGHDVGMSRPPLSPPGDGRSGPLRRRSRPLSSDRHAPRRG